MTNIQIFSGLLICVMMIIKPFLYKPAARHFPAELSAVFTCMWLMAAILLTFPFWGISFIRQMPEVFVTPFFWISVAKGIGLWKFTSIQQSVNKESTSSAVFWGFIALALSCLVNNLFFYEGLKSFQLFCICCFGVLGAAFMIRGDAKRLSAKGKIFFVLMVILGAFFSVADHLAIPQIGWYGHLVSSYFAMFVACLMQGVSKADMIKIFKKRELAVAGSFNAIAEFFVIFASINLLPVSFVSLFNRLSVPIVMLISAYYFKEQTIRNQLIFGILALLLALPLILIR